MAKTINVRVFPARVILTTDRVEFAKLRAEHTDDPLDLDDCDGISSDYGPYYLVGVFDGSTGVLVHELAHTTFKILRDCGVPAHADGNQEAICYLQQWLYDESIGPLNKTKRKAQK